MANKHAFKFKGTRYVNTNQSGSNTQRTWTRYGYMDPDADFYNAHTFRPEGNTPSVPDPDIGTVDFNQMFPTNDTPYGLSTGRHLHAIYLQKEGNNEILPMALAGVPDSRFHGSGRVYRAEAGPTVRENPINPIRNGAQIVFEVVGRVRYDEEGWESLIFTHSGTILTRDEATKTYIQDADYTYTRWTWEVVFHDYFPAFDIDQLGEDSYDENAHTPIEVVLVDEKILIPHTHILYKNLADNRTRKDKPIFEGPPLLVNNLHENGLPLGFDVIGTRLWYNGAMNGRKIMAPSMYNIGPVINSTENCRVYGAVGRPLQVAAGGLFSVLEHFIGDTVPSDFAAHNAKFVGRRVRNREGTYKATINFVNYKIGGKAGVLFDVDLNEAADALTDGLMFLRYMFGLTNQVLINNAVASDALRDTPDAIQDYMEALEDAGWLDIDGDGTADALTDGLMILRYMFGLRNTTLTDNAVAAGATRTTAEIQERIEQATSKQIRLNEDQTLYIGADGQPEFTGAEADQATGGATLMDIAVTVDSDSLLDQPSRYDDIYIEMLPGEELNNIRNSAEKDSQGSASFNLESWDYQSEYVTHITSQDTGRPDTWIPHDFYGDAMLVVEPVAVGAYSCNVGVKTASDDRTSRKINIPIRSINSNAIIFDNNTSPGVTNNDILYIVNNGTTNTLRTGYYKVSYDQAPQEPPLPTSNIIVIGDDVNPKGIGTHEGPYDDIELYHIGGPTGVAAPDEYTNFHVQGYAGPTQEVTLTNNNKDYRVRERITANIDMLPVGEVVLVKYDKDVSFVETIEEDMHVISQECPPYLNIFATDSFRSAARTNKVFMAGDVVLPRLEDMQNTAECLFEHGGSGEGTWIGVVTDDGVKNFHFRAGNGSTSAGAQKESLGSRTYKKKPVSEIPEFDGKIHTVCWLLDPGPHDDSIRAKLWIDNRLVFESDAGFTSWSGGNDGGWGQGHSSIAGFGSGSAAEPYRRRWSGKIHSHLRVYELQEPVDSYAPYKESPVDRKNSGDTITNGNCRIKEIGGDQQIITPIAGGSRYRTAKSYRYDLLQSPTNGLTNQRDLDQFNANPRVSEKIFQVEGNVRSVPLEATAEFDIFGAELNVTANPITVSQTLQGTDGIRCIFKLNNTFDSEEEMEDYRGKIVNVEVINQNGGTLARTSGPLKILAGRLESEYYLIYNIHDSKQFWVHSAYTDLNNFTEADMIRKELDYVNLTQENIDAGHFKVYLRHDWENFNNDEPNDANITFGSEFDTGMWAHARANQEYNAQGTWLGGRLPDTAWSRLADKKLKLDDDLPVRVYSILGHIYNWVPAILITSTELQDTAGFIPDSLIHDSSIFIPDGTSESWDCTLRLTLEKDGQNYYYQAMFQGDYKKEYGIDILEPSGESRLNSNSKPLRFVASASGEQTPSGLVDGEIPVGSEDANGIEDLGHPWAPFSYNATTPGYLEETWMNPKDGTEEYYGTIGDMWALNNLWSERPANGNVDTSHKQTIYIDIYYGGQLVISTTGRRSGYQLRGNYNGLGTTDSLQISEAGVEYQRTNAKIIADDRSQVWYLYDRNVPGDFVQPITYDTPQYLSIPNDQLSEQEFVVVNNEPESMVGVELDTANGRYNIIPTDWPNDPVDDVSIFDRTNNYGRQDWHLNHKYALQVLKVK